MRILETIQSIWLSFQIPLQPGEVNSCLSKLISFFKETFFCFFVFTSCFGFNFVSFYFSLNWFTLVLVMFLWSCCNFIFQGDLIMISDFSPRLFVRLTNLVTFNKKQLATLLWIFSCPSVLTIKSLKKR